MSNVIEFPSPPEMAEGHEPEPQCPLVVRVQVVPQQPQAQPAGLGIVWAVLSGVLAFCIVYGALT